MTEGFVIKQDVLVPQHEYLREYTGNNPARLFKFIPSEMQFLWQLETSMFFEDKIYWDKSGDPITFYGEWRGKIKNMADAFTIPWLKVRIQGYQATQTKIGTATIWIYPWLQTEFKYTNPFFDSLRYFYIKTLYQKQIHEFVKRQKEIADKFDKAIRELFEVHHVGKEQ